MLPKTCPSCGRTWVWESHPTSCVAVFGRCLDCTELTLADLGQVERSSEINSHFQIGSSLDGKTAGMMTLVEQVKANVIGRWL